MALAGVPQTPHPIVGYFGVYPARMAGALAPLRDSRKRQIGENGPCGTPANVKTVHLEPATVLVRSLRRKNECYLYNFVKFSLSAFITTQKLERLIAAAPNMGVMPTPNMGIHTPAANGMPTTL